MTQQPKISEALPPLPTRDELAAFFRVHTATIDRLVGAGELSAIKFGGTVRFSRDDVIRFIERSKTSNPLASRTRKVSRAAFATNQVERV